MCITHGENLQTGVGANDVTADLADSGQVPRPLPTRHVAGTVPFPDLGKVAVTRRTIGISTYNGLQTKLEQQFSNGLTYLLTYTWSKTISDAGDLLMAAARAAIALPRYPALAQFDCGLGRFRSPPGPPLQRRVSASRSARARHYMKQGASPMPSSVDGPQLDRHAPGRSAD